MSINALTEQFIFGMSFLDAYIHLCNKTRLTDINILAETFMCKLLSIIYQSEYQNANISDGLTAGYDLFCDKEKVIVQVTSECSSTKILSTFETLKKRIIELSILERRIQELTDQKQLTQADRDALDKCRGKYNTTKDIRGYRIKFLFLTNDTSNLRKNQRVQGAIVPNGLQFDYKNDILDFASLINSVLRDISCGPQAEKLEKFMQSNPDVFVRKEFGKPNIQRIIDDYASNYVSPLFLHKYEDSGITLQNLYIDPSISRIYALDRQKSYLYAEAQGENRDMIGVLCDFLWQKRKNDKERILFIEGDAAIGKTSLISWLCYHYSQIDTEDDTRARRIGRAIFMNRKIVCIRLRELDFSTPGQSAISVVLKYLEIDSLESFNNQYANAILLLDGADELSMVSGIASSSIETFLLDLRKAFSDHKLIVTTRPKFLNMDAFNKATFQTRHIVLNHFNKEMRQEWLEKYKACGETIPSSTETYILSLSDEMASGVADTPLALYLLVRCDMREELQGNNWALFHEIFSNAIVEAEYNENFRSTANDLRHRKAQTNYQVVCRIAYQMFQNAKEERYYVTESEIQEAIRDTDLNGISPDLIRQTCALCAYWKNSTTLGALEFYHNNIRDFFLCEYLCGELITCFREATKETLVADLIELGCRVFAWGNIPGTTWEQTLAFLYLRLKYEKESARKDDSLFDLIQRKPHIHPVMHMLAMGSRLWNYNYQDVPYLCAKYTFVNMMMLIRVLMEFIHDREKLPVINLWHDDAEKELWSRIGILRDWRELFAGSVVISDSLRIGIGSRTYLGDINLSQSTLIKPDFRGAILTNSQFQKSQIQQGTFAEAELTGSDFSESNMPGANFTKANLADASFEGATLLKAVFSGASLLDVSFVSANVNGACFTGSRVEGCDWKSAKFGNNSFSYAEVCGITIGNKKVERLIFDHSSVKKLVIQGANLLDICICDSSVFYESNFSRTEFILSNPDFGCIKGATFIDCDFKQSKINGMKCISNVHAEQCSFRDANLNGLRIENCTFVNCDFQDASFMGAVFINCKFSGESTNLIGANFSKADGTHSDFTGINFYRVITKGAKGFEEYDRINPYATLK